MLLVRFLFNLRMGDTNENKDTHLQTGENDDDHKRKLWRKFRPKLWFSSIWKRYSLESKVNDFKTFLKINIVPASISVAVGVWYLFLKSKGSKCKVVPYSDLLKGLQDGSVTRVQFKENSRRIMYNSKPRGFESSEVLKKGKNGMFKFQEMLATLLTKLSKKHDVLPESHRSRIDNDEKKKELIVNQVPNRGWQFSTRYIDDDYRELLDLMKEKGTTYGLDPEPFLASTGRRVFSTLLSQAPSWAMLFLVANGLGGGGTIARKPSKNDTVTFDDIEGDSNYENLGAKLPRGILLVGPPGTGKTLLARAVAERAGVPFFITCASEFVEMFVGRGASRIRDLFKEAKKCAPSIIFIDELDAVGLKRGRGFNTEDKKVVVIAATNRPEMLDSALLRAGRFSRKVFVREPDEDGRKKILAIHFRGVPLEDDRDVIFDLVASMTPGLVGADLANIANEAALLAARRGGVCVSRNDVMEAVERAKQSFENRQQQYYDFNEQEAQEINLISSRLLAQSRFDF
ncbi:AAA+ ATPase domain-containing protein [Cynara cardunculus var. scolymus]|uniref:ATP-dependent zinc metalloprotease FTSH, chloroplastic n=1 Tax=Cynara cardunculus var. scolymus TaxID=59895 RepID=A0A103XKS7_CYNCS|nr:AAA+ ATPase domain-containing protein [Cynara cardunculus var. scolymus]